MKRAANKDFNRHFYSLRDIIGWLTGFLVKTIPLIYGHRVRVNQLF